MSIDFPEPDWKVLRELSRVALDRFCARVLADIDKLSADTSRTHHERYGEIYQLMRDRDRELSGTFNDLRRSQALMQLGLIVRHGLITDAEMSRFSETTRKLVERWSR